MDIIEEISEKLKKYFTEVAEKISKEVKFIKRERKITASSFVKAVILGNFGEESSKTEEMCQMLYDDGIQISKQGLEHRYSPESEELMKKMFEEGLSMFQNELKIDCEILNKFRSVKLHDSSYIKLPSILESRYSGYNTHYPGQKEGSKAGIKIQTMYDYLNQSLKRIEITEGKRSDQGYRNYLQDIEGGDLFMADLGYFVPSSMKEIENNGAYFIFRYKSDTNLYDLKSGEKVDLLEKFKDKEEFEENLYLGKEAKIKVRLVAKKLTEEQSQARRRKANKSAKSQGYQSSRKNQKLLDWSIFVTNISKEMVKAENLYLLYKLRWQIELLFRIYKSYAEIDKFRGKANDSKILCSLYGKLSAITIFHGLAACVKINSDAEFSMMKAIRNFRQKVKEIFNILRQEIDEIINFVSLLINSWQIFAIKDKHRKKRLSTLQNLKAR